MLDVAMRNTERLSDLVDNLLVLVRLDDVASFDSVGTEDVAVTAVVSGAIDTVRPEVVDRGQHLEVELPPEPAVIRGDAAQLDRVLVNLLSNAAKYTPRAGRIAVSVTTDDDAPRTVRITVADSGIGIPPDEVPHLFGRFFRASTARASAISGNGLGLAIVKSIVERHGGQVGVESTVGVGSRFTVTLPLAAAREASSPFAPDAVGGHR
jgi:signal transduction histidine kinase